MEIDYKHTWVIPKDAWYIRVYLWVWQASPSDITFCKLFWGYTLIWLGVPLRLALLALSFPFHGLRALRYANTRRRNRKRHSKVFSDPPSTSPPKPPRILVNWVGRLRVGRLVEFEAKNVEKSEVWWRWGDREYEEDAPFDCDAYGDKSYYEYAKGGVYTITLRVRRGEQYVTVERDVTVTSTPPVPMRVLNKIGDGFTGLNMVRASVASTRPVRLAGKAAVATGRGVLWMAMPIAITVCVGMFVGIAFLAIFTFPSWSSEIGTLAKDVRYPAAAVGGVVLVALMVWLLAIWGVWMALKDKAAKPVGRGVKYGALSFKEVMKIGYVSVKSNTCPRVMVEEDEPVKETVV